MLSLAIPLATSLSPDDTKPCDGTARWFCIQDSGTRLRAFEACAAHIRSGGPPVRLARVCHTAAGGIQHLSRQAHLNAWHNLRFRDGMLLTPEVRPRSSEAIPTLWDGYALCGLTSLRSRRLPSYRGLRARLHHRRCQGWRRPG